MSVLLTTRRLGGVTDEDGAPPPPAELRPLPQLSPSEVSSVLRRFVLEYGEDLALGLVSSAFRRPVRFTDDADEPRRASRAAP